MQFQDGQWGFFCNEELRGMFVSEDLYVWGTDRCKKERWDRGWADARDIVRRAPGDPTKEERRMKSNRGVNDVPIR